MMNTEATKSELDEMVEGGLRALRRASEKARRTPVITVEDLELATERLESVGFSIAPTPPGAHIPTSADEDPNLALASLRVDLERKLRTNLKSSHPLKCESDLIEFIYECGAFSREQASALVDLLTLLNSAVHGAVVSPKASEWAARTGPAIIAAVASE